LRTITKVIMETNRRPGTKSRARLSTYLST
jgi:hypothetical protein